MVSKLTAYAGITEGERKHFPGIDCCLHRGKDIDIVSVNAPASGRDTIDTAWDETVEEAIPFSTELFWRARVGNGGCDGLVEVKAIIAAYRHTYSRAGDMQWHDHLLLMSSAVDENGTVRQIHTPIFRDAEVIKLLGAFVQATIAEKLHRKARA